MIRISKMTLAAAVGLAFSGAAFAQGPDRGDQGQFQGGQSSQSSQSSQSQASGDFKAFQSTEQGQEAQRQMQSLDTNRDQKLDRSEAQTDSELMAAWTDVDINSDGSVDTAEYYLFSATKAIAEMEGQQSASVRGGAGNVGGGFGSQSQGRSDQGGLQSRESQQPGQGGFQSPGSESQQDQGGFQARVGQQGSRSFDEVDIDRNGQISQSELSRAAGGASFSTLDTNSDGQIDRQEYSERALN